MRNIIRFNREAFKRGVDHAFALTTLRDYWFMQAWRLHYAGRMIERTRCTIRQGFKRADAARDKYPNWRTLHPRMVADNELWQYEHPE